MKYSTVTLVLIFTIPFILASCTGKKKSARLNAEKVGCETLATVMDYTGLDGCSLLLKLDNGRFISPNSGVTKEELLKAERVRIEFTVIPDRISYCMKGEIADITCFSIEKEGVPLKGRFE